MKSTLAILLFAFTFTSEAAYARYMECNATDGSANPMPEFSIKVAESTMHIVEYRDYQFNFAILYDLHGTVPYLTVGVGGPLQNFSVAGEKTVSITLNNPNLAINCQLVEDL